MIRSIYRHLLKFGLNGLIIYLKIKTGNSDKLRLAGIKEPIKLRPQSSDIPTFYQMFLHEEYDINLDFDPKYIIDGGANIGLAAIFFAHRYVGAQIISIEPEQSNFKLLQENTHAYPNIKTIQAAITNTEEKLITVQDIGLGNWGFVTSHENPSTKESIKHQVKTINIDSIMATHNWPHIDVVKLDVEGAEKEIFASNFESWLPKTKCLIIELHDRMKTGCSKSFFAAISQYNFSYKASGENLVFINTDLIT